MTIERRPLLAALRSSGVVGAAVYWFAAQLWPASVAVVLSMLATTLFAGPFAGDTLALVFGVLIKYNTLMALSAANLPFALPANMTLSLIMVCGTSAASAVQAVIVDTFEEHGKSASTGALGIGMALGFAPSLLLAIPGLTGLACAIAGGLSARHIKASSAAKQTIVEGAFYLGALATWRYV